MVELSGCTHSVCHACLRRILQTVCPLCRAPFARPPFARPPRRVTRGEREVLDHHAQFEVRVARYLDQRLQRMERALRRDYAARAERDRIQRILRRNYASESSDLQARNDHDRRSHRLRRHRPVTIVHLSAAGGEGSLGESDSDEGNNEDAFEAHSSDNSEDLI